MIQTDHDKDEDNNNADGMSKSTPEDWGESKFPPKDSKTMKFMLLLKKRTSSC